MVLPYQVPPPDYRRTRSLINLPNSQLFDMQGSFMNLLGQVTTPYSLPQSAEEPLIFKAIEYITNTALSLPWEIVAEDAEDRVEQIKRLEYALKRPNGDYTNTYKKMVSAIIFDLLRYGVSAIERQPKAFDDGQEFYLWVLDPLSIEINQEWTSDRAGVEPRYYARKDGEIIPLLDENLFLILPRVHSDRLIPKPPLQVAYETMRTWRKLYDYQSSVAANAHRNHVIYIEDGAEEEVNAFRQFMRNDVEGQGSIPTVGGAPFQSVPIGSRSDDELFLRLAEYLIGLVGLIFGISRQNMGIPESVGLNSGGVAETATSSSYQNAVKPIATLIIEGLNQEVIEFFADGVTLRLVDTEPRGEIDEAIARDKEADTITKYLAAGVIDIEEARARAGYAPRKKERAAAIQKGKDTDAII